MRQKLKDIKEKRMTFFGEFSKYGSKAGWSGVPERTILLLDITKQNGKKVTEHLWFNLTKGFQQLQELKEGDKIQFDARVKEYVKGYAGHREELQWEKPLQVDYKLSHPTKIKKVK